MIETTKLSARLQIMIEPIAENMAEFAKNVQANPLWALENSDRTFLDAARLDIYTRYSNALVAGRVGTAEVREDAMSMIMLGASTSPSTSEVTNMVNRMKRQVYVEIVRMIDGGL